MKKINLDYPLLLLLMAIMLSISWLLPNHQQPWTSFHSDFLTAIVLIIGCIFFVVLNNKNISAKLDMVSIGVIGFFLVCVVQYLTGKIFSLGTLWINCLYILGLFIALVIGRWWHEANPQQILILLFASAFIGALLSVAIQIYQLFDFYFLDIWIISNIKSRYFGNLGQPNQLGSLLLLGILGLIWFFLKEKIHPKIFIFLGVFLFFGLSLTESRTGWLNVFFIFSALVWWRKIPEVKRLFPFFLLFIGCYIFFIVCIPYINNWIHQTNSVSEARGFSDSARLNIYYVLFKATLIEPWTGYGWGQLRHAQFSEELIPIDNIRGTLGHAHNLVFDLMIWNGIPIGILFSGILFFWFFIITKSITNLDQLIMFLFVMVLLIHGMLEFPLQYGYFLFPFGLMMGAISDSAKIKYYFEFSKYFIIALLIIGLSGLIITTRDYLIIEDTPLRLMEFKSKNQNKDDLYIPDVWVLEDLRDNIVLSQKNPKSFHSEQDIKWAEDVVKTTFGANSMLQLAMMYSFSGKHKNVYFWQHFSCRATQESGCKKYQEKWEKLSTKYPEFAASGWHPDFFKENKN